MSSTIRFAARLMRWRGRRGNTIELAQFRRLGNKTRLVFVIRFVDRGQFFY